MTHDELGLTLHPFDHATNKVLALVGRVEARDWIDVMECHDRLQPLGYLAWAAAGKDPGFSPAAILEEAARTARYSQAEVDELLFAGPTPDAGELSRRWRAILRQAREVVRTLPAEHVGKCVLDSQGHLGRWPEGELSKQLATGVRFHEGRIRGAWPKVGERLPPLADLAKRLPPLTDRGRER